MHDYPECCQDGSESLCCIYCAQASDTDICADCQRAIEQGCVHCWVDCWLDPQTLRPVSPFSSCRLDPQPLGSIRGMRCDLGGCGATQARVEAR
jgi:hypothetical protein